MVFVKPSNGDDPDFKSPILEPSTFDPHQPQHRASNMDAINEILTSVKKSFPRTGLQQFWRSKMPVSSETVSVEYTKFLSLWSHVIFSHANVSSTMQSNFFTLTIIDCYKYLDHMKLFLDVIQNIEAATHGQSASELWY